MATTTESRTLPAEIAARPILYLLSVGADGHPHTAQVFAGELGADQGAQTITVRGLGKTARANIERGSPVSLMWPPTEALGYTLIVNATPQLSGEADSPGLLGLTITRAVLHRPGQVAPGTSECGSDCIPL